MNNQPANHRTWIFQANPNKYLISDSLKLEQEEYWNLNQHAKEIHSGDRVLIWISGQEAGIYALGTVLTEPVPRPDSVQGMSYWVKPQDGQKVKPRVLVHYDKVLLENPLLKLFIQNDPLLWGLKILTFPRGTNFPVKEEEWKAIKAWLDPNW